MTWRVLEPLPRTSCDRPSGAISRAGRAPATPGAEQTASVTDEWANTDQSEPAGR